ncbi:glycosyltransferase family 4 protein [Lichenicoccus sp.]|uniref:glycosyltransferase family 4 protein n=1 Tax=Lichenicoccus sp. TaxID=2781899 RepID=UPI003D102F0F
MDSALPWTSAWPVRLSLLCLGAGLLCAVLVRAMIRVSVLDTPGPRSAHDRPTPKGGGVGVIAAFLLGLPLAGWWHGDVHWCTLAALLAGVALLALVSWLDDLRQFHPLVKLIAQAVAAGLVLAGIGPLPGGAVGVAVGFAWLLFVTNALNFIDGLNGLAAGSMALACLFVGLPDPATLVGYGGCLLAAGLLGFLPFNMPRARIFLGDVGSQAAGLAVAAFGLLCVARPTLYGAAIMPLLLSGILYDVAFTLGRRLLAGDAVWQAHRGHLYQVAFRSGIPAPAVAALHWGFVTWGGVLGLAITHKALSLLSGMLLMVLPQLAWTMVVVRRARAAGIGRW